MFKSIQKMMVTSAFLLGASAVSANEPQDWVELGNMGGSAFSIDRVIDSTATYPYNSSYELLEEYDQAKGKVKTVSRAISMDCETQQYMMLGAALFDPDNSYLETESNDFVNDPVGVPEDVVDKFKIALCQK